MLPLLASVMGVTDQWTYGHGGLLWGGLIGWSLSMLPVSMKARHARWERLDAARFHQSLDVGLMDIGARLAALESKVPASPRFYEAVIDALPVRPEEELDETRARPQAEWESTWPSRWPRVRRRLIDCYGIPARTVDDAQAALESHCRSGHPVPTDIEEIWDCIETWKEAENRATEMLTDADPFEHEAAPRVERGASLALFSARQSRRLYRPPGGP